MHLPAAAPSHGGARCMAAQALRAGGASGADIVAALAAGSSTFAAKTEFSQEKYRKRKSRKYLTFVTIVRPTARSICEVPPPPAPRPQTAWLVSCFGLWRTRLERTMSVRFTLRRFVD